MNKKKRAEEKTSDTSQNGQQGFSEQEPQGNQADEKEDDAGNDKEETAGFEAKYHEMNDKYLRLYSEFENFRRRTAKEKLEMMQTAGAEVITQFLPVLDDFERAMASNKDSGDINAIKEGVSLVHQKFNMLLLQNGVKEIDALGKKFDTDLHEAVTKIPAPSKKKRGKIMDVIEKGYYLHDKVIRYAKVVIGE